MKPCQSDSSLRWYAQLLLLLLLLPIAKLSFAEVVIAGQTIGKSKWNDSRRLPSAKYNLEENAHALYQQGPVLKISGPILGNIKGDAELFYDESATLVAAKCSTDNPTELLNKLARKSGASLGKDNIYTQRDLRLRIEKDAGRDIVYISSPSFDAAFPKPLPEGSQTDWKKVALWSLAASAGALAASIIWKRRLKIWARRETIADYVVGLAVVGTFLIAVKSIDWSASWLIFGECMLGYSLIVTWALRTVRLSGWLPRRPLVEILWALPSTPILLVPTVIRNMLKAARYAGLVLFFAELFGLVYYFLKPGLPIALVLLPLAGLFAGGVVRLYCATFDIVNKKAPSIVSAVAALVLWPLTLAVFLLIFCYQSVCNLIGSFLFLLIPAVILYISGVLFQSEWVKFASILLPFSGIIPGVAGLLATGLAPTGYGSQGSGSPTFDSLGSQGWDINPANGMPMFGGIGGFDVFGNTFGNNFNDPF